MTGRHRARGRHRAPVQQNPRRRFAIVCGCALCAAVIPLFAHQATPPTPPDLTSAVTQPLQVVAPVVLTPTPPIVTMQPRVDTIGMVDEVNGELSKHHDKPVDKVKKPSSSDDDTSDDTGKQDKGDCE